MLICGVDEVGRGCLAGEVVAAAVVFGSVVPPGLRDSKKLSPAKREELAEVIRQECMTFAIGTASVDEINKYNIRQASFFAMQRAVSAIVVCPDKVLVDGNAVPDLPYPAAAIVGGDDSEPTIMAASILAKVWRDGVMKELDASYPQYGFTRHKGYPTAEHIAALKKHGVTPHHRSEFAPVRNLINALAADDAEKNNKGA